MKKFLILVITLTLFFGMTLKAGRKEFKKGSAFITGEFGFNSWATPFGVGYEKGLNENIGFGVSVWMQSNNDFVYRQTLITPSVFAQYHFTKIRVPKLDVAAGASIGYSAYSASSKNHIITGSSGLFLSIILTIRYYFTDKLAVSLKETYSFIGDWSGSYAMLGLTFKLK